MMPVERMRRAAQYLSATNLLLGALFFAGCETVPQGIQQARIEMAQHIAAEPTGDYYIGRRYYKPDYKFWGYVRKPGQPWSTAELVMLNEKSKLAPDRERLEFGSDNNYEYKLYGSFSGDKVYEPASNGIYPEFVLKKNELISTTPPPIFKSQMSGSSSRADRADARKVEGSRGRISKPSPQDSSSSVRTTRDPLTEEFLRYLANERNASPRTLKAYRHALTSFRAENKTSWKKCAADDFRNYLFAVMKRGQARSYVRLQFSALRTFYQFLAARKQLRHN